MSHLQVTSAITHTEAGMLYARPVRLLVMESEGGVKMRIVSSGDSEVGAWNSVF